MTKKEERNLTWKLSELPTAGELAELVDAEVMTKEEARDMMFGSPESDKDKIKALEDQVALLLELVKSLSNKSPQIINVPYTYARTGPYWEKYWMNTNKVLTSGGFVPASYVGDNSKNMLTMSVNTGNTLS